MSTPAEKLRNLYARIPAWKQIYYRWRALRGVPFRKRFFVGYDLDGNTYWEFFQDGLTRRPRRLVEPHEPQKHLFNYFEKVPIQWAQWLKFSRKQPPSVFDIIEDEERVRKLQIMTQFRDSEQLHNKQLHQQKVEQNLQKELHKISSSGAEQQHAERAARTMQQSGYDLEKTLQHKEIKSKSNVKLETDASKTANQEEEENAIDPWKQASTSSDKPDEANITPRR
jgi:NADH dehydrogenase [ubiquinone] 1 alpha subcomplex assembly factor 2